MSKERGRIDYWNSARGYGFIRPDSGGDDVFLHIKALAPGIAEPERGDVVEYEIYRDYANRTRAVGALIETAMARPGSYETKSFKGGAVPDDARSPDARPAR
jgi:cold shock CspA family protein